jgi:hypothetical protein
MPSTTTNLLPSDRRHKLVREYYFRLVVVVIGLVIALIGVAAILLMPTYIYLLGTAGEKQTELAHVTATLASASDATLSARLAALSKDAAALIALSKKPSVSAALRSVLGVSRPGVSISGFTYLPDPKAITAQLTGTAATRDALRSYQLALQNLPAISAATLPVSVYAKDTDISFTITLTLMP